MRRDQLERKQFKWSGDTQPPGPKMWTVRSSPALRDSPVYQRPIHWPDGEPWCKPKVRRWKVRITYWKSDPVGLIRTKRVVGWEVGRVSGYDGLRRAVRGRSLLRLRLIREWGSWWAAKSENQFPPVYYHAKSLLGNCGD